VKDFPASSILTNELSGKQLINICKKAIPLQAWTGPEVPDG
jgi:hypothetical protein